MRMYDVIECKRNRKKLSKQQIEFFINGFVKGEIPEYQASALMMAVYFNGMDEEETSVLTQVMANSGDTVNLTQFGDRTVDKHSTGGVGDKTTLIVAPIVAAIGGIVAKMSGRALGHTGGTIDKLESIPGYSVTMDRDSFFHQISKIGISIIGQSGNLAPADKKLYALRDVTATVDSIPLIASSIMSKKIASGAKNIVLDVKVGSGAFIKEVAKAKQLAQQMVDIGKKCGRNMSAIITDMDIPLGNAIGNMLEVKEAIAVLNGNGPSDLRDVSVILASQMLQLSLGLTKEQSVKEIYRVLESGEALEKFKKMVVAQGGDVTYIEHPEKFEKSFYTQKIIAPKTGYISQMKTDRIGVAASLLGAGRKTKDDKIDYTAGILLTAKTGDFICEGQTIATLYTNNEESISKAQYIFENAISLSESKPIERTLIYDII